MPTATATHTTTQPPLPDLDVLDSLVTTDPNNVIQVLPDVLAILESRVLRNPKTALDVWNGLKALIKDEEEDSETLSRDINALAISSNTSDKVIIATKSDEPPYCTPIPKTWQNMHNETWSDEYYHLNNREDPNVLAYIEQENTYSTSQMTHTLPLQKLLYKEFVSRMDTSQLSPSVTTADGWMFFTRHVPGLEYKQHVRVSPDGEEDVILDENVLVDSDLFQNASCFNVGFLRYSPDYQMVAYGVDVNGNERYQVHFLNLNTKQPLPDTITDAYEDFEWSASGKMVYYTIVDDCERACRLMCHKLGTPVSSDRVLYDETDESFFLKLRRTCSGKYMILTTYAQVTTEVRYWHTDDDTDLGTLLFPRRDNISCAIEDHEDWFYVLTNEDSKNNWIYRVRIPEKNSTFDWEAVLAARETVIEHRDFVLIEDFQVRKNHLIVFERSHCLQNVRIVDIHSPGFNSYHYISFPEPIYSLWPGTLNEEIANLLKSTLYDSSTLRFTYTSFITPRQVVDYHFETRTLQVVHQETVGAGLFPYDPTLYVQKRLFATGIDGTTIPISIVYRKDLRQVNSGAGNPCLLHSYGAYGSPTNAIFSHARLSLLDRGFVYAVAHVRGGAEMGNAWYEEGKLGKKPNTFLDFISCAEYLCKEGFTTPSQLAIYGRSAGGLLIGASITMRPDLFQAALMEVPFVDVINTMFDPTIPWTAFEYEEWGNPADKAIYDVMKSYCPYTQLKNLTSTFGNDTFPNILVVGGMNDPRVAFWEPLKFVARIRHLQRAHTSASIPSSSRRKILLQVADVGHGGSSGQYSYLEEIAFEYAFIIDRLAAPLRPILPPGVQPSLGSYLYSTFMAASSSAGQQLAIDEAEQEENADVLSPISEITGLESPVGSDRSGKKSASTRGKKTKRDNATEEREYRGAKKGDRGPNKLYQWLSNFF